MNEMRVNVLDPKFGDELTATVLGWPDSEDVKGRVHAFKERLRAALVAEGMRSGASLNTAKAVCEVLGGAAIAHVVLAGESRLILEKLYGVPLRLHGELPDRPRRWKTVPLEVFTKSVFGFSPEMHFVVAPAEHPEGEYERWVLLGRTLQAIGVTKAGVEDMFRFFRPRARRYRVLLDGRVQIVRCLPEWVSYMTLGMFDEDRLRRFPNWAEPSRRAELAAAADQYNKAVARRLLPWPKKLMPVTEAEASVDV